MCFGACDATFKGCLLLQMTWSCSLKHICWLPQPPAMMNAVHIDPSEKEACTVRPNAVSYACAFYGLMLGWRVVYDIQSSSSFGHGPAHVPY